jgi:predicted nuclease of restriction endonuclease-like (RecB) superfamily
MVNNLSIPEDYHHFFEELKERIRNAQLRAALAINRELILLYWQIRADILNRQQQQKWGAKVIKVIDNLAADLRKAFPEMKGFSSRNLKYMRSFAETYQDFEFVQEVLAQITWYHNITLIEKVKSPDERLWYARQTIEQGWSRNVLVHQIESGLYKRQGKADTNFSRTLPNPQSELAQQLFKDPYNFDFITLSQRGIRNPPKIN